MHIKKFLSAILFIPLLLSAQSQPDPAFASRIFTGGSLGLQFGTFTLVEVEPIIGYKVTDRFAPGISMTYIYSKYKDPSGFYPDYSTNIYGGSIFARYYFLPNAFGHVEYQVLNLDLPSAIGYNVTYHRGNIEGVFIGGGYRQIVGEHSSFNILLLYDINHDPFSPYDNPVLKVGFGFGI